MKQFCEFITSKIGILKITASDDAILSIWFSEKAEKDNPNPLTNMCAAQLAEYFSGLRRTFQLNINPQGTPFQQAVWMELARIPYAQTRSYKDIAEAVGNPKAVRAIGQANKRNPIAIIIPCHRVIQKNGTPGGYNGQPWRKELLLKHEASFAQSSL